jgi:hypothetical protein
VIAAVLALGPGFFGSMGLGHIYVRSIAKGIVYMVVGLLFGLFTWILILSVLLMPLSYYTENEIDPAGLAIVGLFFAAIFFSLWFWQAYDAYKLAKMTQMPAVGGPSPQYN